MIFHYRTIIILIIILSLIKVISNPSDTLKFQDIISKVIQAFKTKYSPKVVITTTTSSILLITLAWYFRSQLLMSPANYRFLSSSSRGKLGNKKSKEVRFAYKNGGELGGLINDGNTCFMNSVIQSLASSTHLLNFIDSYLSVNSKDDPIAAKNTVFTTGLKSLLDNVNGKYGDKGREFTTKSLLNKMPNGPKQNFFTGYNQEDAQEFYQLVMNLVEKEYKGLLKSRPATPDPDSNDSHDDYIDVTTSSIKGWDDDLSKIGKVYVPASQVDPNLEDADHKLKPLELITPVDGVSVERIGCLTCGEVGGMRYSVNSGLSLNLPQQQSYYSGFELHKLLDEWITPEIIEDVNCNRCGLQQTKQFLKEKIINSSNEKVIEQFQNRIHEIDHELNKPCVTDEAFEKLTIKQMIKKSKKSKQILLSRPPPLLSIHINRSVFDPRTYMIVKNSSKVSVPLELNLGPFVGEPEDINMDARLPFRKQDERMQSLDINEKGEEEKEHQQLQQHNVTTTSSNPITNTSNSNSNSDIDDDSMNSNPKQSASTIGTPNLLPDNQTSINPKLVYKLKALISHYGTHNYGHYICYRKLRGTWWRISDESVYVTTEDEVLNAQGTFMVFYEYDNGKKENLIPLDDDSESEDSDNNESNNGSGSGSGSSSMSNLPLTKLAITTNQNEDDDLYGSSGLSSDNRMDGDKDSDDSEDNSEADNNEKTSISDDYNLGEERAFHM